MIPWVNRVGHPHYVQDDSLLGRGAEGDNVQPPSHFVTHIVGNPSPYDGFQFNAAGPGHSVSLRPTAFDDARMFGEPGHKKGPSRRSAEGRGTAFGVSGYRHSNLGSSETLLPYRQVADSLLRRPLGDAAELAVVLRAKGPVLGQNLDVKRTLRLAEQSVAHSGLCQHLGIESRGAQQHHRSEDARRGHSGQPPDPA